MEHNLLIDNWTLQSAGELICGGLKRDEAHKLYFSADMKRYEVQVKLADAVRLECLCQLLHNIVFADVLHVDGDYTDCWEKFEPLVKLKESAIILPKQFRVLEGQWTSVRDGMAEVLCPDDHLRKLHWQGEGYEDIKFGLSPDPFFSQVLWGGAGMLARASFFQLAYEPHPVRQGFFKHARFLSPTNSAKDLFRQFVNEQRIRLFERLDTAGFSGLLRLPPVAVEIIQEASSLDELLKVARQKRDDYRKLRMWLAELQTALNTEDIPQQLKKKLLLEQVGSSIDGKQQVSRFGEASVEIGYGLPAFTLSPKAVLDQFRNRFGVRAQISRLILRPSGYNALRKVLKFLGEEGSAYGLKLEREFFDSNAKTQTHNEPNKVQMDEVKRNAGTPIAQQIAAREQSAPATENMVQHPSSTSVKETQEQVFISYSHRDKKFLDELLQHLRPLERVGLVSQWSDKQISPGSQWFKAIRTALARARIAVLMVSPGFLASDFIHDHELGPLLKEAERGGVRILWIPVRACSYKETALKNYQAVIPPEKPLAQMKANRDAAWVIVCEEIKKAVNDKP